jgi:hypothetical protein
MDLDTAETAVEVMRGKVSRKPFQRRSGASAGFPFPGASQCVVHGRPLAPGGVKPKAASTCLQSSDPTRFLAEMIAQGAARVTGLISETRSGVA